MEKGEGAIGKWFVSRMLKGGLPETDYIILNDVYLPLPDGTTTQVDHIVVSRYGIFAVETKNYSGWIFADANSKVWTQTIYRKKSTFQNPMRPHAPVVARRWSCGPPERPTRSSSAAATIPNAAACARWRRDGDVTMGRRIFLPPLRGL